MLFSYNSLEIPRFDDIELIFKNLIFTRLILELSAKETLERLVKKVGTPGDK